MKSHRITLELELGGYQVQVHGTYYPGEPARISGPPEKCHEGEAAEFDCDKIELVVPITDDLSPRARAVRNILVPLDDILADIPGAADGIAQLIKEKLLEVAGDNE